MPVGTEPLGIVALVSARLSSIGVTHMLSGSAALSVYAEPRMSRDLDFVVDLGGFQVPRFWWSKDTGSELQRRDVRNLIESAPTLDWAYVRRWASHLGVEDLLTAYVEN
jgi:hypothetical protein